MNITTQQLAEILAGIARTQQAIIDAVEGVKPGFKGTYLAPVLDSVAKIRATGRTPTLQDFPARVLLQCQSRTGPNIDQITRDLESLLTGTPATPPPAYVPAPAAPAAAAAPAGTTPGSALDLDMT